MAQWLFPAIRLDGIDDISDVVVFPQEAVVVKQQGVEIRRLKFMKYG